jgi:helicase
MSRTIQIKEYYKDTTINIILDTLEMKKQALIFCNSKRSAEKTAEDVAGKIKATSGSGSVISDSEKRKLIELSEKVLKSLSKPTKQCQRLARCVSKGIAFHHAGLTMDQKTLVEDAFRNDVIKIISCTPTLCISGDSKIWHSCSETKISKFKNSKQLFVLSKNKLVSMKAQKIEKNINSSKLIQISSVSGYKIKVTPNHKMLIKRENRKIIEKASDIKKTDKIATIGRINLKKKFNPKINSFVKDNKLPLENVKFDEKLSYLIGVMLGDGYSGAETINKKIKYKGSPSIVGIDEEIFENIKESCKDLKLSFKRSKIPNGTPQVILGKNKWFREFLVRCGVEKGEDKYISDKLMNMSKQNITALLKGLFDTDGYVDKRIGPGFCNTSKTLIKQIQKLLLRFGIVTTLRSRKPGSMQIYEKEYKTKKLYELNLHQKRSVIDFYRFVGFNIKRKQDALIDLIAKIYSNLNYVECKHCKYKIYKDLFSGRSKQHKKWGSIKLEVIKTLGERKELGSKELKKIIGDEPRKKETRLNHHYFLIKKRRVGSKSKTEWYWSLNDIGKHIYNELTSRNKHYFEFFKLKKCPLCNNKLEWVIKKGWRDDDFEGDIFWDKIRKIKDVDCENIVYDVVLPNNPKNNHMFVAEGFIIHNSFGLDLPAFRVVIKNLGRYTQRGMQPIPVLEYHQMCGRAGRPGKAAWGEAITIATTEAGKEKIIEDFVKADAEDIFSKLAVEPVLRFYLLSLIASEFVRTRKQIMDFFNKTFWAHQFKDMYELMKKINKMLILLEKFGFIESAKSKAEKLKQEKANKFVKKDKNAKKEEDVYNDFMTADEIYNQASGFSSSETGFEDVNEKFNATQLGKRVSELYIDPLTAYEMICAIKRSKTKQVLPISILQMLCVTLEIRPKLRVKVKEYDEIIEQMIKYEDNMIVLEPSQFDSEFDDYVNAFKTALFFNDWIEENGEEYLLEKYDVRPGEIRAKLETADWLLYAAVELGKILGIKSFGANDNQKKGKSMVSELTKMRLRMKYGVKEELLVLLKLKNIGRVRARKLNKEGIKDLGDIKKADIVTLAQLVGKKTAIDIKDQVGVKILDKDVKVKENKRKGQISLMDF